MTMRSVLCRLACASALILGLTSLAAAQSAPNAVEPPVAAPEKASAKPDFAGTPAGQGGRGAAAQEHAQEQGKKTGQSAAQEKAAKAKAAKDKAAKDKAGELKKKGGKS